MRLALFVWNYDPASFNSNNVKTKITVMFAAITSVLIVGIGMNSIAYASIIGDEFSGIGIDDIGQSTECVGVAIECRENSDNIKIKNNNNNNGENGDDNFDDGTNELGTLEVTKTVRCDSNGGIPDNEAVCIYALVTSDNRLTADTFQITVIGNNPDPSSFQARELVTEVSIRPGIYSVSESVPTNEIDALLNELRATTITISTTVTGDCNANYDIDNSFIDATGTMTIGDEQTCDILNSITINGGRVPR